MRHLVSVSAPLLLLLLLPGPAAAQIPSVATEAELSALADIRALAVPPEPAVTYHVSVWPGGDFPRGDDANPGTPELPIKTLDEVRRRANAGPCPVEIVMDAGEVWSKARFGEGLHHLAPSCDDPDEVGIYIHSSDPDERWFLDGGEATPGFCDGTGVGSGAITAGAPGRSDGGWVVVANFELRHCDDDGLDTSHEGRLLALDFRCYDVFGGGNQCATPHASTRMVMLNFSMEGGDASGEYSAGMQPVNDSVLIAMHGEVRWGGSGAPFVGPNGRSRSLLYGVEMYRVAPFTDWTGDVISSSDDIEGADATLSLLVGRASSTAFHRDVLQAFNPGVDIAKRYRFFRTTFEGASRLLTLNPQGADTSISYHDRCSVYDDYGDRILTSYEPPAKLDLNIASAGFTDDASSPFRLDDESGHTQFYATVEEARAGAAGGWTNFFQGAARPGEPRRCTSSWFEPFPVFSDAAEPRVRGEQACLPAFVTGKEICALYLNQDGDQPYGFSAE